MSERNQKVLIRLPQAIHIDELVFDPDNVRSTYDEQKLLDLRASIREHGIIQNLQAYKSAEGTYTVIIGNRRLAATKLLLSEIQELLDNEQLSPEERADLEDLAYNRSYLPVAVLEGEAIERAREQQLVENLQREDISPVDEAKGYQWLVQHKGLTPVEIGNRIGKTPNYVRQRLKLMQAPEALLEALERGEVVVRVCEMVGRVPRKKDREELAKRVLNPQYLGRPLNERETAELIGSEYVRPLRNSGFDQTDSDLVRLVVDGEQKRVFGGSCEDCPFRTGNDPELQEHLAQPGYGAKQKAGVDPNLCTNPSCYKAKQDAAWQLVVKSAEERGNRVMTDDAANQHFGPHGLIFHASQYEDLGERPSYQVAGHYDDSKLPKWSKLLSGADVQVIVARNPYSGRIHHLVDRKEAIKAANKIAAEKGEESPFADAANVEDEQRKEQAQRREEGKLREKIATIAIRRIFEAGEKFSFTVEDLQLLARQCLALSGEGLRSMAAALGVDKDKRPSWRDYVDPVMDHLIDNVQTPEQWLTVVVLAANIESCRWEGIERGLEDWMARMSIDCEDVKMQAESELKEQKKKTSKDRMSPEVKEIVKAAQEKRWPKKKAVKKKAANKQAAE